MSDGLTVPAGINPCARRNRGNPSPKRPPPPVLRHPECGPSPATPGAAGRPASPPTALEGARKPYKPCRFPDGNARDRRTEAGPSCLNLRKSGRGEDKAFRCHRGHVPRTPRRHPGLPRQEGFKRGGEVSRRRNRTAWGRPAWGVGRKAPPFQNRGGMRTSPPRILCTQPPPARPPQSERRTGAAPGWDCPAPPAWLAGAYRPPRLSPVPPARGRTACSPVRKKPSARAPRAAARFLPRGRGRASVLPG